MPRISLGDKEGRLEISSYNGNSQKKQVHQLDFSINRNFANQKLNFFRQESNHAYVQGNILYEGECKNNLIISPYKNNKLVDVSNAFLSVKDSYLEISSISNISNVLKRGKEILSNKEIDYNIPKAVFERENLTEKDLDELKGKIEQEYSLQSKEIFMIDFARTKNGIYYIKDKNNKEFVLKFRGKDNEKAEILMKIAERIPEYFPIIYHRTNGDNFIFKIGKEFYGLEEFVRNISPKTRDLKYFSLLGKHIGILHNYFLDLIEKDKGIGKALSFRDEYTNESNISSLYLDLSRDEQNKFLLSELEKIIEEKMEVKINSFSKQLIHKDLNHSNLVWNNEFPKIIDFETIRNSVRLNEFESPLLFGGNMKKPEYIKNSLNILLDAYNQTSKNILSNEEIEILPLLLKYALLRNFVIRRIRRGMNDEKYINELKENFKKLDEDTYDN